MDLGAYLAAARTKPWKWREHDCTAFPAIWAGFGEALPHYTSEADAEAMLHAAGGLVPLWQEAVAATNGKAAEIPRGLRQPGDVGVIELPAIRKIEVLDPKTSEVVEAQEITSVECGAIWTGKRWAFFPMRGGMAAVASATVLKVWRPLCLQR